jgi:hypothetical protein
MLHSVDLAPISARRNIFIEQEVAMKWIRKFARTVILVFGSFTLMCVSALGQNTRGFFTLSHEVHWQNQVVPAGDYKFSVELRGSSQMLTLRNADGEGSAIMILVNDTDNLVPATSSTSANGRLRLIIQSGHRYVSSMEVPSIGMTLHFDVPTEPSPLGLSRSASSAAK